MVIQFHWKLWFGSRTASSTSGGWSRTKEKQEKWRVHSPCQNTNNKNKRLLLRLVLVPRWLLGPIPHSQATETRRHLLRWPSISIRNPAARQWHPFLIIGRLIWGHYGLMPIKSPWAHLPPAEGDLSLSLWLPIQSMTMILHRRHATQHIDTRAAHRRPVVVGRTGGHVTSNPLHFFFNGRPPPHATPLHYFFLCCTDTSRANRTTSISPPPP